MTFLKKSTDGICTSSRVSFNDNGSSDIDELLPFEHVEIFHTDTEDKDFDRFSDAKN